MRRCLLVHLWPGRRSAKTCTARPTAGCADMPAPRPLHACAAGAAAFPLCARILATVKTFVGKLQFRDPQTGAAQVGCSGGGQCSVCAQQAGGLPARLAAGLRWQRRPASTEGRCVCCRPLSCFHHAPHLRPCLPATGTAMPAEDSTNVVLFCPAPCLQHLGQNPPCSMGWRCWLRMAAWLRGLGWTTASLRVSLVRSCCLLPPCSWQRAQLSAAEMPSRQWHACLAASPPPFAVCGLRHSAHPERAILVRAHGHMLAGIAEMQPPEFEACLADPTRRVHAAELVKGLQQLMASYSGLMEGAHTCWGTHTVWQARLPPRCLAA